MAEARKSPRRGWWTPGPPPQELTPTPLGSGSHFGGARGNGRGREGWCPSSVVIYENLLDQMKRETLLGWDAPHLAEKEAR